MSSLGLPGHKLKPKDNVFSLTPRQVHNNNSAHNNRNQTSSHSPEPTPRQPGGAGALLLMAEDAGTMARFATTMQLGVSNVRRSRQQATTPRRINLGEFISQQMCLGE